MSRVSRFILPVALTVLFTLPAVVWATDKPKYPPKPVEPVPIHIDRCALDSWSIKCGDKQAHFIHSAIAGLVVSGIAQDQPKHVQFGIAMIPGTVKEVLDQQKGSPGFSWKDMTWNALGAASGVYLGGWFISRQGSTTVVGVSREF